MELQPPGRNDNPDPPTLAHNEDHLHYARSPARGHSSQTPTEHSPDNVGDATMASMNVFAEEQRLMQKELEESSQRHHKRMRGLESAFEEKIRQGRHEAEMKRKAVEEKQKEEYKRREAELSRRWMQV